MNIDKAIDEIEGTFESLLKSYTLSYSSKTLIALVVILISFRQISL